MASDLISRDALKSYIDCGHLRSPTELCFSEIDVVRMIDKQPAVDAVEVVRCKDCMYWTRVNKHSGKCPFLIGEHQYAGDNHYCSCGERREEDGEAT